MNKLTDEQWVELISMTLTLYHNKMRLGQAYMNSLAQINVSLYNEITGTSNDPFYNNVRISDFMEYLNVGMWKKAKRDNNNVYSIIINTI